MPIRFAAMSTLETNHNPRVLTLRSENALREAMSAIGSHQVGIDIMATKAQFYLVWLDGVAFVTANLVKQSMLAKGGDAVIRQGLYFGEDQLTDVLLMGTWAQYQALVWRLGAHPVPEARALASELAGTLAAYRAWPPQPIVAGATELAWGQKTHVMGIINATPDSFSGDGVGTDVDLAVQQAQAFVEAGADILDIGGESTRPGSKPVDAETEQDRVLPVIEAVAGAVDIPISVDTYRAKVAAAALDAGADFVNDVWALRMDPEMAPLVAERGVPIILMHNRSRPKDAVQEERLGGRYVGVQYGNLMGDILRELRASISAAVDAGIDLHKIIVDPGIGFGKTVEQNLTIVDELDQLRSLGRPILVGPSRKSFIGYTLDVASGERLLGTLATVAVSVLRGADIVRVHDVAETEQVVQMLDAIVRR
jgi:dihydropteroate synthase